MAPTESHGDKQPTAMLYARSPRLGAALSRAVAADQPPGDGYLRTGEVLSSSSISGLAAGTMACPPLTIACAVRSFP